MNIVYHVCYYLSQNLLFNYHLKYNVYEYKNVFYLCVVCANMSSPLQLLYVQLMYVQLIIISICILFSFYLHSRIFS